MKQYWMWLFYVPDTPRSIRDVFVWWEERRLAYNFFVGVIGFFSFLVFAVSLDASGVLGPGEDAVEPVIIIFAPIVVNLCYCAGWIGESILRVLLPCMPGKKEAIAPVLLMLGILFSLCIMIAPALLWLSYRLLQLCNVIR